MKIGDSGPVSVHAQLFHSFQSRRPFLDSVTPKITNFVPIKYWLTITLLFLHPNRDLITCTLTNYTSHSYRGCYSSFLVFFPKMFCSIRQAEREYISIRVRFSVCFIAVFALVFNATHGKIFRNRRWSCLIKSLPSFTWSDQDVILTFHIGKSCVKAVHKDGHDAWMEEIWKWKKTILSSSYFLKFSTRNDSKC